MADVEATTRSIAALVRDVALRTQLEVAVQSAEGVPDRRLLWCKSADDLYRAVAERGAAVVITEWDDAVNFPVEAVIRRLRAEFSTVPVLAYVPLTPTGARALLAAGQAGVSEAMLAGYDDIGHALYSVIARAADAAMADNALARLAGVVPSQVLAILAYVFRHARAGPGVGDIANALGLHRKTLAEQCRRAGVPPPGELASWGRLVIAAARLADRGRTAEQVAARFRYRSGSALASMLKRYTGLTVSEARQRGPASVLDLLISRLHEPASLHPAPPARRRTPTRTSKTGPAD